MNTNIPKSSTLKLLITIVDYNVGARAIEICESCGATHSYCHLGYGTANSTILDYLGLGETRKLIVFTIVKNCIVEFLMKELDEKLKLSRPGGGITFAIPIDSIGGVKALKLFLANLNREEER